MSKGLILFPFGGNAREAVTTILNINKIQKQWNVLGFMDDHSGNLGKECCGIRVLGGKEVLKQFPKAYILAVPGNPDHYLERERIIHDLNLKPSRFAQIVHPSAVIAPDAHIGYNTLIMPNVIVGCGVSIGDHCLVLGNSVVAHDSVIADYCCIGYQVNISGHVRVGRNCYIGSGANIRDHVNIGAKSLVGLGANVIKDVGNAVVVAGNPAKIIRKAKMK